MGGQKNSKGVTVYHPENNTITTQLDMNFDRKVSSCTVFQSAKHGNREVIFIGGGSAPGSLNTAEILDYSKTDIWEQGKSSLSHWTYWLQILSKLCFQRVALSRNYEIVAIITDKNTFLMTLIIKMTLHWATFS